MSFLRSAAVLFLLSLPCFAQSFTQKSEYPVGVKPSEIALADFNADGAMDVVVGGYDGSTLSVLLGRGDGTFAASATFDAGTRVLQIVAADMNGDGRTDLLIAGDPASMLIGNGDGTFRRISLGMKAGSVAAGDFNGDGKLDVALGTDVTVKILLGNGDGSMRPGSDITPKYAPSGITAGDINGDGISDLIIDGFCCDGYNVTYTVVLAAFGNGDGTFNVQQLHTDASSSRPLLVDMTRDGKLDIVNPYSGCHTPCHGITVAVNDGSGHFPKVGGVGISELMYSGPAGAAVADFNLDGIPDLATGAGANGTYEQMSGSNYDKVVIWTGKGDGSFPTSGDYPTGVNKGPGPVATADFNRDGKPDVVAANFGSSSVTVLLNDTGTSADQRTWEMHVEGSSQPIQAGQRVTFRYFIEPTNGALPEMKLSFSGLPTGVTVRYDDIRGWNPAIGFIDFQTSPHTSSALRRSVFSTLALVLPIGFVVVGSRRRTLAVVLLALAVALVVQVGCAGVGSNSTRLNGGTNSNGPDITPGSGATGSSTGGGTGGSSSGGSGNATGGTPAGSYNVTVTATGGGFTKSQTVTFVVQ